MQPVVMAPKNLKREGQCTGQVVRGLMSAKKTLVAKVCTRGQP